MDSLREIDKPEKNWLKQYQFRP